MKLRSALSLTVDRVVTPIEGMHRAISSRCFRIFGPAARPVQITHDTISSIVYASIRAGSSLVGWGIDTSAPSVATADSIQAWTNGLWGDQLGSQRAELELAMSVRDASGNAIAADAASSWVSTPTPHLVFFVHGLVETERRWVGSDAAPGLASKLEARLPVSPVLVRYNTGLAVEANGTFLADLIEEVVDAWPLPVESISLVGHSMGGLVATSAYANAAMSDRAWADRVSDVVSIGTPHGGAPLEALAEALARGLNLAATTRPLAAFLHRRSQGIKDLRVSPTGEIPLAQRELTRARHHFVAGVITSDPSHPLGALVGDLMVRPTSSSPPTVESSDSIRLGGVHHFNLLDEPRVADHVTRWLDPALEKASTAPSPLP